MTDCGGDAVGRVSQALGFGVVVLSMVEACDLAGQSLVRILGILVIIEGCILLPRMW